jgi:LacI family transcriptional regulator
MARKKRETKGKSISLREVARIAGVSPATVSLAMKESPRLAQATKERIRKIAKEQGYRPNPRLSRILSETVTSRYDKRGGLIYLVVTRYTRNTWNPENPWFLAMSTRCHELGYTLEPFWIFEPGLTPARANQIMYSRGVDGLIIHPPAYSLRSGESLTLPIEWEKFCVVEIDDVITEPVLHHVRHDHLSGIWLALQKVESLGYRRIGFCLSPVVDFATHHRWTAGYSYWADTRGLSGPIRSPSLFNGNPKDVRKWIKTNRLDAVIGPSSEILRAIQEGGLRVPHDVAFAALDLMGNPSVFADESAHPPQDASSPASGIAGILQCRDEQFTLAVDMIVALIARGFRGIPDPASTWILSGKWQDGATCPPRSGRVKSSVPSEGIPPFRRLPKSLRTKSGG